MEPMLLAAMAALILFAVWRLGRTFRASRSQNDEEIRRKLAELRKKRDEQ